MFSLIIGVVIVDDMFEEGGKRNASVGFRINIGISTEENLRN
jgi:hypothetical protein